MLTFIKKVAVLWAQLFAACATPGHHSFVTDPATGADLIVYPRWEGNRGRGPYRGKRWIATETVSYASDGSLVSVRMTGRRAR